MAEEPTGRGRDPFLTAPWVRNRGRDYTAGTVELDDPRVSPRYADLRGLPPLYLPVAEYDTLYGGVVALAEAAWRRGSTSQWSRGRAWRTVGKAW